MCMQLVYKVIFTVAIYRFYILWNTDCFHVFPVKYCDISHLVFRSLPVFYVQD